MNSSFFYIEDDNFLEEHQKENINFIVNNSVTSFYLQNNCTIDSNGKGDNNNYLCHTVLKRPEERNKDETFNSEYKDIFIEILNTFLNKHKIKSVEFLRCSINLTFNVKNRKSPIHEDHNYPHKQLIIYMNEPDDNDCKTVILDSDEKTILKEVSPKKFKGVCFESKPHYMIYPKTGIRVICVMTFR